MGPKQGTIKSGCDEEFSVVFSPTECEPNNRRLMIISFENLDPEIQPLIIELDGDTERPICHFEL